MFEDCKLLIFLPDIISEWKTYRVTEMSCMFKGCSHSK